MAASKRARKLFRWIYTKVAREAGADYSNHLLDRDQSDDTGKIESASHWALGVVLQPCPRAIR